MTLRPSFRRLASAVLLLSAACDRRTSDAGAETAAAVPAASAPNAAGGAASDTSQFVTLTAAAIQHGNVRWAPATTLEVATSTEVPAQLVPNEDRTARLGAPASGRVVTVHVQAGQRVARGQALVTLQSVEAGTARADYAKAAAELAGRRSAAIYARTARERAERLLAAKAISRQELERAQSDDALAQATLAQAEAEIGRTRGALSQLGVSAASASGTMVVRAPSEGVVLSREAVPGSVVEPGAPLVTVSDVSTLWLDIAAPERAASALAVGSRVRFTVAAFPADTMSARVVSIGGALDAPTRTVPVRAAVDNARRRLRALMYATAWVEGGTPSSRVVLPERAVVLLDQRAVVFVAHPDGRGGSRFERRDVKTAAAGDGMVQILSGLIGGELVVTDGAFAVKSEFSRGKFAEG
jgi:cobalt-zinc-cadmium efflux system membrane fusion protein